jgi:hypothetical protein
MAKIDYRCTQYGECEKADTREIITLEPGEEPLCPEADCGKPLTKVSGTGGSSGGSTPPLKLIAAAVVLILIIAAAVLFWPSGRKASPATVEDSLVDVWPWLKGG